MKVGKYIACRHKGKRVFHAACGLLRAVRIQAASIHMVYLGQMASGLQCVVIGSIFLNATLRLRMPLGSGWWYIACPIH